MVDQDLQSQLKKLRLWQEDKQEKLRQQQMEQLVYLKLQQSKIQDLLETNDIHLESSTEVDDDVENNDYEELRILDSNLDIDSKEFPFETEFEQQNLDCHDLSTIYEESNTSCDIESDKLGTDEKLEDGNMLNVNFKTLNLKSKNLDLHDEKEFSAEPVAFKDFPETKKMALNKSSKQETSGKSMKPKFPFLKKGQGTSRFYKKITKSDSKDHGVKENVSIKSKNLKVTCRKFASNKSENLANNFEDLVDNTVNDQVDSSITNAEPLECFEKNEPEILDISHNSNTTSITDSSFGIKMVEAAINQKFEKVELEEFEMLEQVANDSAISCNSAEPKELTPKDYESDDSNSTLHGANEIFNINENIQESFSVHDPSKECSNALQKHIMNSDPMLPLLHYTCTNGISNMDADNLKEDDFDDSRSWTDEISNLSVLNESSVIAYDSSKYIDNIGNNEASEIPKSLMPSNYMSSIFNNMKPSTDSTEKDINAKEIEETRLENTQSNLMLNKLSELEKEIDIFRSENSKFEKFKTAKLKEFNMMKRDQITIFKRKEEELEKTREEITDERKKLEDEKRKFRREKTVYEENMKNKRSKLEKIDDSETKMLKAKISDLESDIKSREKRWNLTLSRYKSRIEILESSQKELKDAMNSLKLENESLKAQVVKKERLLSDALRSNKLLKSEKNSQNLKNDTSKISPASTETGKKKVCNKSSSNDAKFIAKSHLEDCTTHNHQKVIDSNYDERIYDDRVEKIFEDGGKEIKYSNGTIKEVHPDGKTQTVYYFNGDIGKILSDETTVYYYSDSKTTQTIYSDGLEVIHFSNNQVEKTFSDGTKNILYPDGSSKCIFPDDTEESVASDGTTLRKKPDGTQIMKFPNGQIEIHTEKFKRRKYPDGTQKTLYSDGRQETQYSNGRVRIKDGNGKVIVDHTP